MTKTDWLMRFRRYRSMDTLETVYEHLKYEGAPKEEYAMTSAYDHRKAELTVGKLFDRVLPRWSELKDFPGGSCDLASNFLARYLMDSDKGRHPCIICMCGNDPSREAENSTVHGHVIVMLDGNYIDLMLDQFEEYASYVPAEPIESGGVIGSLLHKIQKHEGEISTRPVKIWDGHGLSVC